MAKTVVGMMENLEEAQAVVRELVSAGIRREDIGFMANEKHAVPSSAALNEAEGGEHAASGALAGAGAGAAIGGLGGLLLAVAPLAIPGIGPIVAAGPIAAALTGAGIGAVAGGLIGGLTRLGVPEEEAHYYAEGVRRGGILVTVAANDDTTADKAAGVMRRHGAVDIDERAAQWKKQGWKGRFEAAVGQEERTIPVTEEELAVGKREVEQGRVRVETRVREEPVQKSVDLEEQRVDVERRPVDRPLAAGDKGFQEQTFEATESREEPVVEKKARVVEEVRVGKQKSRRKQTVQDTVRKTEVDVQRGGAAARGTYKGPERRVNTTPWLGEERRRAA